MSNFKSSLINLEENESLKAYSPAENIVLADFLLKNYMADQFEAIEILNKAFELDIENLSFEDLKRDEDRNKLNKYREYVKTKFKLINSQDNDINEENFDKYFDIVKKVWDNESLKERYGYKNFEEDINKYFKRPKMMDRPNIPFSKKQEKNQGEKLKPGEKEKIISLEFGSLRVRVGGGEIFVEFSSGIPLYIFKVLGPNFEVLTKDELNNNENNNSDDYIILSLTDEEKREAFKDFLSSDYLKAYISRKVNMLAEFRLLKAYMFDDLSSGANINRRGNFEEVILLFLYLNENNKNSKNNIVFNSYKKIREEINKRFQIEIKDNSTVGDMCNKNGFQYSSIRKQPKYKNPLIQKDSKKGYILTDIGKDYLKDNFTKEQLKLENIENLIKVGKI